jgi:hypothetical protein
MNIQKLGFALLFGMLIGGCATNQNATGNSVKRQDPVALASYKKMHGDIPAGQTITLTASAVVFTDLTLNDGCVINFTNSLTNVHIIFQRLVLNGDSTIDLTPAVAPPPTPQTPPPQGQARADSNSPHDGPGGTPGALGSTGRSGINLDMVVDSLFATNGSLWIKTDGTRGGQGGTGGDGGKGSSGPRTGIHNPNGGNGGSGGRGGDGGKGGNTGWVKLKVGHDFISPTQANGVAPSSRPQIESGTVIISGAPGDGGPGGGGGGGGPEGEGHKAHFPATDSQSGRHGGNGANGVKGPPGDFVAAPPR